MNKHDKPTRYRDMDSALHAALSEMFGPGYLGGVSREAPGILRRHLSLIESAQSKRLADDTVAVESAALSIENDCRILKRESWNDIARNALRVAEDAALSSEGDGTPRSGPDKSNRSASRGSGSAMTDAKP